MSTPRELWLAAQSASRRARPRPTVRTCRLISRPDGWFDVLIDGSDLRTGAVPPRIEVGGQPVIRIEGRDGSRLTGVVDRGETGDEVTVDLGPAGAVRTVVEGVA
ncbi:hypothetical protein [Micromonospora sp. LOL_015]|uniref:hypothetical protein n=1 Tax=Micromonospora sp. LOL_015 TaxID=3345416 RepID=UPI003A83EF6F